MGFIRYLLLFGALFSGILTTAERLRLCNEWRSSSPEGREDMTLGIFGPVINRVRAVVPENEGILLYSAVDPALFPYALFPRTIYQVQTDPETSAFYMDVPPSTYGAIDPESLPVGWLLGVDQGNIMMGGELLRRTHGVSR